MRLSKLLFRKPAVSSPRKFSVQDWKEALEATKDAIGNKRIGILAAGIAYFMTLGIFPLIAATIATASFVLEPEQIKHVATNIENFFPKDIATLVNGQLSAALTHKSASTIVAVVAILIALFSVSGAVQNAVNATNVAYDVNEDRSFIRLRLVSFELMLMTFMTSALIGGLLLLNSTLLEKYGIPTVLAVIISIARWVLLPVVLTISLAFFYRYGPNRSNPKWQWVSWGSIVAAFVWFLATVGFFIYARYFANFSESYGTFAGLVVLMSWLNISAFVVLLGAEVNHRLENQTFLKTTK